MEYYTIPFNNVRNIPDKNLFEIMKDTYNSSQRGFILEKTDDFCSDRVWCKDNGISFLNLTNWEYWTVAAYLHLNLEQENSQEQSEKTATA